MDSTRCDGDSTRRRRGHKISNQQDQQQREIEREGLGIPMPATTVLRFRLCFHGFTCQSSIEYKLSRTCAPPCGSLSLLSNVVICLLTEILCNKLVRHGAAGDERQRQKGVSDRKCKFLLEAIQELLVGKTNVMKERNSQHLSSPQ